MHHGNVKYEKHSPSNNKVDIKWKALNILFVKDEKYVMDLMWKQTSWGSLSHC